MRVEDRLLSHADTTGECWIWIGGKRGGGYGHFRISGKSYQAHRVSYELFVGQIPDDLEIDHLCRNIACIRPDHLEPVTREENMRRRRKTHCDQGHELVTHGIRRGAGRLRCGVCYRAYKREWRRSR